MFISISGCMIYQWTSTHLTTIQVNDHLSAKVRSVVHIAYGFLGNRYLTTSVCFHSFTHCNHYMSTGKLGISRGSSHWSKVSNSPTSYLAYIIVKSGLTKTKTRKSHNYPSFYFILAEIYPPWLRIYYYNVKEEMNYKVKTDLSNPKLSSP